MSLADTTPRLRMFAGPNGSGKSTIKSVIDNKLLGDFVNPDEIEAEIKRIGWLDFQKFSLKPQATEILDFFQNSTFLTKANLTAEAEKLTFRANKLGFSDVHVNSYLPLSQLILFARNSFKPRNHFHLKP